MNEMKRGEKYTFKRWRVGYARCRFQRRGLKQIVNSTLELTFPFIPWRKKRVRGTYNNDRQMLFFFFILIWACMYCIITHMIYERKIWWLKRSLQGDKNIFRILFAITGKKIVLLKLRQNYFTAKQFCVLWIISKSF